MAEKTSKKVKCGVAGVGYLGKHHARIYNSLNSCDLVGVFDPDLEVCRRVANDESCNSYYRGCFE